MSAEETDSDATIWGGRREGGQCRETARILLYYNQRKSAMNIRDKLLFAEKFGIANSCIQRNDFTQSEVLFRYAILSVLMQYFVSNVDDCLY